MSLTDHAYALIRREIVSCTLPPGAEFTEVDLAGRLQMSKTPVREALARLQFEGLVRAFPRRGYRIEPIRLSDINDVFDARVILEAGAIALAVGKIGEAEFGRLRRLARSSSDAEYTADLEYSHRINNEFHEAIALASGNQRLHRMVVQTNTELERFFYLEAHSEEPYPPDHVTHTQIVDAIEKGDPKIAQQAIVEHIEGTRRLLIGTLTHGQVGRNLLLT
jgi:DNA-binding GntR family transcriptional regulator